METSTAILIKTLLNERDQLIREIEALRNKVIGLEVAVDLISGRPPEAARAGDKGRVTKTIVGLLRESGETGLKAKGAVELAAGRGITLNSGSVYALLHRMARSGSVVREGGLYKLREFAARGDPAAGPTAEPRPNGRGH
jgi:hypothetical protein